MPIIGQTGVRRNMPRGFVGQIASADHHTNLQSRPQLSGAGKDAVSLVVSAASSDTEYAVSVTVAGQDVSTVSYTSDADATVAEIAAGIAAALQADPVASGLGSIEATGSSVVYSVFSRGEDVSLSSDSGDLAISVSEGNEGETILVGRAVYIGSDGALTHSKPSGAIEDVLFGAATRNFANHGERPGVEWDKPQHVECLRTGMMYVEGGSSAKVGDQIYVGTAAGPELGRFFAAAGTGRTALPKTKGYWADPNVIELRLGR